MRFYIIEHSVRFYRSIHFKGLQEKIEQSVLFLSFFIFALGKDFDDGRKSQG